MTQDCPWCDSVVELYVWTQLALFAHQTLDHDLVMTCTHNALQLEQRLKMWVMSHEHILSQCVTYRINLKWIHWHLLDVDTRNTKVHQFDIISLCLCVHCRLERCCVEMLCSAACVRGQSLIHEVSVDSSRYEEGLQMLQSSVRSEHVSWRALSVCWCVFEWCGFVVDMRSRRAAGVCVWPQRVTTGTPVCLYWTPHRTDDGWENLWSSFYRPSTTHTTNTTWL